MRKLAIAVAGAAALAFTSPALAETVNNIDMTRVTTTDVGSTVLIDFAKYPLPTGGFTGSFDVVNPNAGVYSISGSSSTPGVTFNPLGVYVTNVTPDSPAYGMQTFLTLTSNLATGGLNVFALAPTFASAGTYRFTFNGTNTVADGIATGNVTIRAATGAVPEPATWAMMLIGFGGMGFSLRRRRREQRLLQLA